MERASSVCYNRDRCWIFNLVLISLDNMSALTFSNLGMCCIRTCSKADWMTFRTIGNIVGG